MYHGSLDLLWTKLYKNLFEFSNFYDTEPSAETFALLYDIAVTRVMGFGGITLVLMAMVNTLIGTLLIFPKCQIDQNFRWQ